MVTATGTERRVITEGAHPTQRTMVFSRGRNLTLVTLSALVREVSARFEQAGRVRVSPPETGADAYLLLDWEQIETIFEALPRIRLLSRAAGRRPEVTVCGVRLPLAAGTQAKGCALISISIGEKRPAPTFDRHEKHEIKESGKALHALTGLRRAIEKHHGTVRFATGPGKAVLNVYLPVL